MAEAIGGGTRGDAWPGEGAETAVLEVVAVLLEVVRERPQALEHLTWIQELLADGYALALRLDGGSLRLGREIEELLETGGPDVASAVTERVRRRSDLDRRARQLRDRLDALHAYARASASARPGGDS